MASDIRFRQQLDFPSYAVELDWLLTDLNLIAEGYDLQSAVIVALGTNSLAPPDEELPDPDATDRCGWWGDMDAEAIWEGWPVGCLLWLLRRAKITGPLAKGGATVAKAEGWTRDAMNHFTQRRIASSIAVRAERLGTERIDVAVAIYRGIGPPVELRYAELWEQLGRGE